MNNNQILILMQSEAQNSYWSDAIQTGINTSALKYDEIIIHLDSERINNSFSQRQKLNNTPVLVVGNNENWLERNIRLLIECGAKPIIVNACMLPTRKHHCSGVVFELEEMIDSCVDYLRDCGRRKVVLLGTNPVSVTDKVKCGAFASPEDIIFANEHIDECVDDFIARFDMLGYNAAICSNDTVAICLVNNMLKRGYKLPEDFYIIGMGNSYVGSQLRVPLTSVMFNYREMGEQAVRLLRYIYKNPLSCRVTVSLPCSLIVRESTRNFRVTSSAESKTDSNSSGGISSYFSGDTVENIIKIEALLQSCEKLDRDIIFALMHNNTSEQIAELTFLSERAVRYRITNIIRRYGFNTRSELCRALQTAIGIDNNENN